MDVMNSAYTSYAALAGYNAFGEVRQISFPMNGVNTTFQYEQATNRLHELTTTIREAARHRILYTRTTITEIFVQSRTMSIRPRPKRSTMTG
jgi:hypothetical protein